MSGFTFFILEYNFFGKANSIWLLEKLPLPKEIILSSIATDLSEIKVKFYFTHP